MSATLVASNANDAYRVSGELIFATVSDALQLSQQFFTQATALNIDLSGVTGADSAGLALLIEWYSRASKSAKPIRFIGVPKQLLALAKISDVDQLLNL